MKAILYREYGPPGVLRLEDVEPPKHLDDEVLVRVRAASVNPMDWHFLRGTPYFIRLMLGVGRPKKPRLGADGAGIVEAVGSKVTQFKRGDEVFGTTRGAFAEFACGPETTLLPKPGNVTFEEAAAAAVAGGTALQALRKGEVGPGRKVLVNGAAGGVGTFAVQIARSFGAEVTGVCSTRNVEMVHSIGADRVIDYTREDFTKSGERYDVFLDNVGNHSLSQCRRVLNPGGRYLQIGGSPGNWSGGLGRLFAAPFVSWFGSRKL